MTPAYGPPNEPRGARRPVVIIDDNAAAPFETIPPHFALLLLSTGTEIVAAQRRLVELAVQAGCDEFCFLGKDCDSLHDYVDAVVEDRGLLHVLTVSLEEDDLDDALFYFATLAGSGRSILVASLGDDPVLRASIVEALARLREPA